MFKFSCRGVVTGKRDVKDDSSRKYLGLKVAGLVDESFAVPAEVVRDIGTGEEVDCFGIVSYSMFGSTVTKRFEVHRVVVVPTVMPMTPEPGTVGKAK